MREKEERNEKAIIFYYDPIRTMRLCTYAFFISGSLMHFVYAHALPRIAPGCSMSAVFKKVLFT